MSNSTLRTDIDLDAQGKQAGYLRVSQSTNESGVSWIPVPIVSIRNGDGPRILLMAGNHGDEYEGQIMLLKLLRELEQADIRGHLIIIPGANAPAVEAGTRVSPLDGGNLNRLFPGDPAGTPTQVIASFLVTEILPRVDYIFDFHSGGYSGEFVPAAHAVLSADPVRRANVLEFFRVFGMTNSIIIGGLAGGNTRLLGACERAGVHHMSTELGGGGTVDLATLAIAEQGVRRLLDHLGASTRPLATAAPGPTRYFRRQSQHDYLFAPAPGLFEPYVSLGDVVSAGQPAGAVHFTDEPWREPVHVAFTMDGTVLCRRVPARVERGHFLFALGSPLDAAPGDDPGVDPAVEQ